MGRYSRDYQSKNFAAKERFLSRKNMWTLAGLLGVCALGLAFARLVVR